MKNDPRKGVQNLASVWERKIEKQEKERTLHRRLLKIEQSLLMKGSRLIAGVDEAGRGPLAGPVVAAAVIFPADLFTYDSSSYTARYPPLRGLNDSKMLSPSHREYLYDEITKTALSWDFHSVQADEIDRLNILKATFMAMNRAIEKLTLLPDIVLVDGNRTPGCPFLKDKAREIPIIKGDSLSLSIAAASVMAKVTRDRIMQDYHEKYPHYV